MRGMKWRWIVLTLTLAGAGCRGCGCDETAAPDAGGAAESEAVEAAPEVPAAPLGADEVEQAIEDGLRAVAARDFEVAIARFEAAAASDPMRRVPHQRLCGLYRQAQRTADALRSCRAWHALESEPDFKARAAEVVAELEGAMAP